VGLMGSADSGRFGGQTGRQRGAPLPQQAAQAGAIGRQAVRH
jgi:hypothetical protein